MAGDRRSHRRVSSWTLMRRGLTWRARLSVGLSVCRRGLPRHRYPIRGTGRLEHVQFLGEAKGLPKDYLFVCTKRPFMCREVRWVRST